MKPIGTLVLMLICALARAEDTLPAPTGPHKIGRVSFHWKDAARDEIETKTPDDKRELMVHLFYPADTKATGAPPSYFLDADLMRGQLNEAQMARVAAIRVHSIEKAPLLSGKGKLPVVLFSPGGGVKALTYHVFLEDMASHGWIVAAVDPPYNPRAMRMADGRVLGNLKPEERGWPQARNPAEVERFYKERLWHWSRDISFVIDQLTALDKGHGQFAGRLDLQRGVGVYGHSRGGQAAATVRIMDSRVRGGINIDGRVGDYAVIPAKENDTAVGKQPFLWLTKPLPPMPTDEQLQRARKTHAEFEAEVERVKNRWKSQLGAIEGGAMYVTLNRPGVEHIDFSDEPFWDGTMTEANKPGRLRTIAETRAWVRAFFEGTVRSDWTGLKRLATDKSPEVNIETFGKLWP